MSSLNETLESYGDTIQQPDKMISQNQVRAKKKARHSDNSNDINLFKEFFRLVAMFIEKNIVLIEKSQCSYSMKELYAELETLGFVNPLRMKAYKFFMKDKQMIDALFGLPSCERKELLLGMMTDASII
ncbi:unnamed protein product [Victoria cruziana]